MEHLPEYIAHLIWLDLKDDLTSEQRKKLDKWLDENPYNRVVAERAKKRDNFSKDLHIYQKFDASIAWNRFEDKSIINPKSSIRRLTPQLARWIAACIVVSFICIAITLYTSKKEKMLAVKTNKEIAPAMKGVLLTLSNGKKVLLDTIQNGVIKLENGSLADVVDGQLSYRLSNSLNVINNIATTSGRHYQMVLADGTKVWLNANSAISFPSRFQGNTRNVKISGEVYFEVMKDRQKPFIVEAPNGLKIEVTGTKFNLNTYADENTWKTTLIEGRVNVHLNDKSITLMPGTQARMDRTNSRMTVIRNIDLEQTIAWKNGLFNFEGATLPEIMRQIERWYDVKVVYGNPVQRINFFGEISRNENLDDVIRALQESGVKLKLDKERRLITIEK